MPDNNHQDTIAAYATPPAHAHAAVVRLSGPGVFDLLDDLLTDPVERKRGAFIGRLDLEGVPLPVRLAVTPGPASYTGEDAAELFLPGSPLLVERVLDLICAREFVRRAGPGEFSARAYLAGKLTLDQAEGVAAVIAAERDDELDAARDLLAGATGKRHAELASELADLLALVEAGVDFTDAEDVVAITPEDLRTKLTDLRTRIGRDLGGPAESRLGLPRVVLAGEPSAGKSTLFNALLRANRSVTDEAPGTTRDAIAETLELDRGVRIELTDLPGLDEAYAGLSRAIQNAARTAIESADLVLHCDPSGRFEPLNVQTTVLRVRTKADLPGSGGDISVCAIDGSNLGSLRRAIADHAHAGGGVFAPRRTRALEEAAAHIGLAIESADEPELAAASMRTALDELGSITGRIDPDEVIGRVFAAFCVGK